MKTLGILSFLLTVPITCFFLQLLLHRLFFRKLPPKSPVRIAFLVCILVTGLYSGLSAALGFYANSAFPCRLWVITYVAVSSGSLSYCYFILFTMSETARRIRILVGQYSGVQANIKNSEPYDPKLMLEVRLKRLQDLEAVRLENGRYRAPFSLLGFGAWLVEQWGTLFQPRGLSKQ